MARCSMSIGLIWPVSRQIYDCDCVNIWMCRNAYWGEYPLSFAACLGQEECVRLLRAKDADINKYDTNGNTALHMVVIHDEEVCNATDFIFTCGCRISIQSFEIDGIVISNESCR